MFIEPLQLIDQTVENLETLKELFAEEIDELTHAPGRVTLDGQRCRAALDAINALIPRLQTARASQQGQWSPPHCANCD